MNPVCVDAWPVRAIEFGDIDDLRALHGDDLVSEIPVLPSASITNPNLVMRVPEAALAEDVVEVVL